MVKIQLRRDTAANWTLANPVLSLGEPGYETDTKLMKYGDGSTAWTSLPYHGPALSGSAGGVLNGTYPNPGFSTNMATQAELDTAIAAGTTPTGPAGGVLAGSYPNPSFLVDMATQAELNAAVAAGTTPTGGAGGVLSGTYPNPGFAVDMATQAELNAAIAGVSITGAAGGVLSGTYPNPAFAVDMATQAELDAGLNLKATIANPTFTGDPKAPTPTAGDNDTSIATTAFVQSVAAPLAPLASPVLTGNPTAPTPAANDNDTSVATTAFVASKQPLNVMDYGAIGNGVADDTAAVDAWILAVKTARGYGISPAGKTFLIQSQLANWNTTAGGVFDFAGSQIKKSNTFAGSWAMDIRGNVIIRNLVVDGNRAGGALGGGIEFVNNSATDVILDNVTSRNHKATGIHTLAAPSVKVTLQGCKSTGNQTGAGGADGFYASGGAFIMDRYCEGSDNDRDGVRIDGNTPGCVVNGTFNRNFDDGIRINGASPGGKSEYLYADDNALFGMRIINTGGTFAGATNWSFGHVEVCRSGMAAGGTYTQNLAATGIECYGITNCSFETVIGRGNLGYDFVLAQGDATHPSANNTIGRIHGTLVGPTGVNSPDNDPSVNIVGGSNSNHIGQITTYGRTVPVCFGEGVASPTSNDYNTIGSVHIDGTNSGGYAAVAVFRGAYNYIGHVICRNVSMQHPGSGGSQYSSLLLFSNDASVHHNLVDRLDHVTSGTAFSYLAEFRTASANNQVTHARGAFATAIKLDTGTGNTVTAG